MYRFYSTLLVIFFLSSVSLVGQVKFSTEVDAKQVIVGSTFGITFTLENADPENFSPPGFSPFKLVSGPSQSYRSTFINGKSSKSVSFSYVLQATKAGSFRIRGATVDVKGKTLSSNAVALEVVKADNKVADTPQLFLKAEVESNEVYVGQQVILRYKIYTQVNIENYNLLSESSYAGCFAQPLDTYKEPVVKEVVDGKEYSTKILRKVAVFPQQGGKIEIEPLVVQVGIPSKSTIRRGLLSSFGLQRKNVNSNGITLSVKSPYENAPADFSGAVGNFDARFILSNDQATTDDAISILLKIRGNGDVKTVRTPEFILPKAFELFDPKVKEDKMINATDSVRGEKTIEYLLICREPGEYELNPSFTHFDPVTEKFKKTEDSFTIEIKQGKRSVTSTADNQLKNASGSEGDGLMYSTQLFKKKKPLYLRTWYIGSYILPLLAFVFLSWRSKQTPREIEINPEEIVRERLNKAHELLYRKEYDSFYEEIAISIKQFLEYKLNLPTADLTKEKITELLKENGYQDPIIEKVNLVLNRCDYAIYAGIKSEESVKSIYEDAKDLLTQMS